MTEAYPKSPCISVCVLDPKGYCRGCYRTMEEIARWPSMSAAEQMALLARLGERARSLPKPSELKLWRDV